MAVPRREVSHPHIVRTPGLCGGRPVIHGTRFPVSSVVYYILHEGMTPEELLREFSHLSLAQVYDALAYYYDNREAVDEEMRAEREAAPGESYP